MPIDVVLDFEDVVVEVGREVVADWAVLAAELRAQEIRAGTWLNTRDVKDFLLSLEETPATLKSRLLVTIREYDHHAIPFRASIPARRVGAS